jgi:hypothetical protein
MRQTAVIVTAVLALFSQAEAEEVSKAQLNTLEDVKRAIQHCWRGPPARAIRNGMELTVRLSFRRNGEIFGARVTHQSRDVSDDEQFAYYRALVLMMKRCSPLPVTPALGEAIAGRPFFFRFHDTRKQREAFLHG